MKELCTRHRELWCPKCPKGLLETEPNVEREPIPRCGLGSCTPSWLQICSSKKTFVVAFGLVGFWYFAASAYFVATISTIEKRFKISSKTTGMIAGAEDITYVSAVLVVGYLGARGGSNKARWVASGAVLMAVSYFTNVIPHLMYGPGSTALLLIDEKEGGTAINSSTLAGEKVLCGANTGPEDCYEGEENTVAAFFLLLSRLIDGLGNSPYWTLGIAYLDDNILKKKAPYFIAVVGCVRMFGPTLGFLLGSFSLNLFVDPSLSPDISTEDPRWIGAWWLGWIPCGAMVLLPGLTLFLFPRALRKASERLASVKEQVVVETTPSLTDFKLSLLRIMKNPVYVFNTLSATFMILGAMGHWYFLPKYMETQFRQSASKASFVTGALGVGCTGIGLLTAGAIMSKFEPSARKLAAWNVFTEIVEVSTRIFFMFIGCPVLDLHGKSNTDYTWNLTMACNQMCGCDDTSSYTPICSADQSTTFYSPCHAGCSDEAMINGTKTYLNCSCLDVEANFATDGACPVDCLTSFYLFLFGECLIRFLSATGRAGNSLIQFRCVHPLDKSVSLGLNSVITSLFGFIPAPVIYGLIIDSACIVWGEACGETGNCWFYDGVWFGYLLNGTAAAFLMVGVVFDVGVWVKVKGLQIYLEDHERLKGQLQLEPHTRDKGSRDTDTEDRNNHHQEMVSMSKNPENNIRYPGLKHSDP